VTWQRADFSTSKMQRLAKHDQRRYTAFSLRMRWIAPAAARHLHWHAIVTEAYINRPIDHYLDYTSQKQAYRPSYRPDADDAAPGTHECASVADDRLWRCRAGQSAIDRRTPYGVDGSNRVDIAPTKYSTRRESVGRRRTVLSARHRLTAWLRDSMTNAHCKRRWRRRKSRVMAFTTPSLQTTYCSPRVGRHFKVIVSRLTSLFNGRVNKDSTCDGKQITLSLGRRYGSFPQSNDGHWVYGSRISDGR